MPADPHQGAPQHVRPSHELAVSFQGHRTVTLTRCMTQSRSSSLSLRSERRPTQDAVCQYSQVRTVHAYTAADRSAPPHPPRKDTERLRTSLFHVFGVAEVPRRTSLVFTERREFAWSTPLSNSPASDLQPARQLLHTEPSPSPATAPIEPKLPITRDTSSAARVSFSKRLAWRAHWAHTCNPEILRVHVGNGASSA